MKTRPLILTILAILLMIEPAFKIFYLKFSSGFSYSVVLTNILQRTSLFDLYKFWFMFPIAGLCLISIRKWTYYLFLGIQLYAIIDFLTYEPYTFPYNSSEPFFFNYILVAANIFSVAYFMLPGVRKVFFDQSMRWWETKKRYKADIPCRVLTSQGEIECNVRNISQTGVFIDSSVGLAMGETVTVEFDHHGLSFSLIAEVASEHQFEGIQGLGLKFSLDSYSELINLLRLIWNMKKELKASSYR